MKARPRAIVAALAMLACSVACSSQGQDPAHQAPVQASGSTQVVVRQVSLPDLTGMAPAVQQQLRDQFDELARVRAGTAPRDEQAAAYGGMGKLLLAAESFGDAETCFLNASDLSPSDVQWGYYLAHVYRLQGDSPKAASYFERTLKARPDDVAALVWLGNVYLDQGRTAEAEAPFSRALALDSRVAAARIGLGRVALAARDFSKAIEQLEAALAIDASATSVHYLLASAYRGAGQAARADAHLRQRGPGQIGPPDPLMQQVAGLLRSPVIYEGRGDRAIARGDFSRAVIEFRAGLELAPENLAIRQKLATALSLTGDVQGAVRHLQEILQRDPTFASAHYSLAVLLLADGQADRAIEQFGSAVKYEPTYVQARLQLGNTLQSRGRFEPAREQYAAVVQLDPRVAEARFGEAIALAGLARFADARDRLDAGARLHPDRLEFVSALARLQAAARDPHVRDGNQALALATDLTKRQDSAAARETLAMALAEVGRYDDAVSAQREAIAMAERNGQRELASHMTANLRLFEKRQPSRTPWRELPMWVP
jgi:tetratricopeptide (TPR) repeat protein